MNKAYLFIYLFIYNPASLIGQFSQLIESTVPNYYVRSAVLRIRMPKNSKLFNESESEKKF
jgi:hypothetical protein